MNFEELQQPIKPVTKNTHIHAYTRRQSRETLQHLYLNHTFLIKP